MKSSTIKQLRLNYIFVVAIILIIAYTIFAYVNLQKSINDIEWIKRSEEIQNHLEDVISQMKDAEAAHRGFLYSRDEHQKASYFEAQSNVYAALDNAEELLEDKAQKARLLDLRKTAEKRFSIMEDILKLDSLSDQSAEFKSDLVESGDRVMAELRSGIDEMEASDYKLLSQRTKDLENSSNDVLFQSVLFGMITLIIVILGFLKISHDLKVRKKSEAKLLESNLKFQALFDQSFQMVGLADSEGKMMDANQPALAFLQIEKSELTGKPLTEIIQPVLDEKSARIIEKAINAAQSGKFFRSDIQTDGTKGSKITIDFSIKPFFDKYDQISLLIVEGRDVTELHKITEALAESREIYDLVLRGSSAGIWDWTDISKDELWWSPKFLELLGYKQGEINPTLTFFKDLLHPEDLHFTMERIDDALYRDRPFEVEYRLRHKSGEYRWFYATGQPIWNSDGKPERMAGSIIDISERKKAEAAFHSVAQLMIAAENIARIGSFEWNVQSDDVIWSEGMYQIYEVEDPTLKPSSKLMSKHIISEDLKEIETIRQRAIKSEMPYQLNYRIFVNHQEKHLKELATVKVDENGDFVGFIGTVRDNTNEVLAAQRINEAMEELERSNKELEQFAYVASHDLQEPLRKIRAFGDRLTTKFEGTDLPGKEYVERMQNAAERMQVLIDDLLTFSRVSRGQHRMEPVDLQRIYDEVSNDLNISLAAKGGKIIQKETLPEIMGSATQMRQLLQNLLANSIKFSKEGVPPKIEIEYEKIARDEVFSHDQDLDLERSMYHKIAIRDNGIGFNEKYLDKIFTIFQRLHGKSEFKGTGIGLAVCKKIVENHGGILTARSKPGEGSEFYIFLPDHL